jgi:hypothetical protein
VTAGGIDFLPNVAGAAAALGQNVIAIPSGSAITAVITTLGTLGLVAGTLVSGIVVEVMDNVGTTLQAVWGDSTGAVLGSSPISAGTGAVQSLPIAVIPQALVPNLAYWVAVNRIAGALGWLVNKATIS